MSNLTVGKIANNLVTLIINSADGDEVKPIERVGAPALVSNATIRNTANTGSMDFFVNLPNGTGFPHKTRCLLQVVSLTHNKIGLATNDAATVAHPVANLGLYSYEYSKVLGVEIAGLTSQIVSSNSLNTALVGVLTHKGGMTQSTATNDGDGLTFSGDGDILQEGVMSQSPFGKRLRITIKDLVKNEVAYSSFTPQDHVFQHPKNHPVVLKLRLLFLDNEDLKDF